MFVLVADYTLRKIISANDQGIIAVTGRAHCQCQVAFFIYVSSAAEFFLLPPDHLFESEYSLCNETNNGMYMKGCVV